MKYREKVNKMLKNVKYGSCCHGNNKYITIILLHSSVSITIIHPIIILTFNFDMLELSLYPIYNGATSTISTCILVRKG